MSYQTPFNHLRVGQVAEIYGVSTPTIWRWLKENRIPKAIKIADSTRWLSKEVIDYMLSLHKEK
jgi:predicted DNA-binding transcriptional regulator AlpA